MVHIKTEIPVNVQPLHEASGGLGNARPGRETSLGWEGRLCRESRLGRETRLGKETRLGRETSLGLRADSTERAGCTGKRGLLGGWLGHPRASWRLPLGVVRAPLGYHCGLLGAS